MHRNKRKKWRAVSCRIWHYPTHSRNGRLAEPREVMRGFNLVDPPSAIALARKAQITLTLNQIQSAKTLVNAAQGVEASNPYVQST